MEGGLGATRADDGVFLTDCVTVTGFGDSEQVILLNDGSLRVLVPKRVILAASHPRQVLELLQVVEVRIMRANWTCHEIALRGSPVLGQCFGTRVVLLTALAEAG